VFLAKKTENTMKSQTTIVSCYYQLPQSKHSPSEYAQWIQNFLKHFDTPIVMFGEGEILQQLIQMRDQAGLGDRFFPIEKTLSELKFSTNEWQVIWTHQLEQSNYKHLHNQEMFRIWANKSFFIEEAILKNPFDSDMFIWCDAGCWRDPFIAQLCGPSWPLPEKVAPNRLQIVAMGPIQPWLDAVNALPQDATHNDVVTQVNTRFSAIVSGTILVGDKAAWQTWIPTFEKTLEYYVMNDIFAGDDQAVITSTALWLHKNNSPNKPLFFKAPSRNNFVQIGGWAFGDAWFCFQEHFSRIDFTLETY